MEKISDDVIKHLQNKIRKEGFIEYSMLGAYWCLLAKQVVLINDVDEFSKQVIGSSDEFVQFSDGIGLKSRYKLASKPSIWQSIKNFFGV